MRNSTKGYEFGNIESHRNFMVTISYGGAPLGHITISAGKYLDVTFKPNPLKGRGHDPKQEWFDLNLASKLNGLRSKIEATLQKAQQTGAIEKIPTLDQVQVGLPVQHLQLPLQKLRRYRKCQS